MSLSILSVAKISEGGLGSEGSREEEENRQTWLFFTAPTQTASRAPPLPLALLCFSEVIKEQRQNGWRLERL